MRGPEPSIPVEEELERFGVPGLAVAAARAGEVLLAEGYGRSELASGAPATARTLFQVGSVAKAFTALLVASLVDDGLLAWDQPVREYLPAFRLADPVSSDRVTLRDLLSHRSGLARHEWVWLANPSLPRAELVRRLRFLELGSDLRQGWQYSNLGYVAVGSVVEAVTGEPWETQLRRRVLEPLGMDRTSPAGPGNAGHDVARPYREGGAELPRRPLRNVAPAGNLLSCAEDLARWLACLTAGGRGVVSEASLGELWLPQVPVRLELPEDPHLRLWAYGLGWVVGTYRGREWVWHNGGVDGFRAEVAVVPQAGVGVAVCANCHETPLPFALLHHLLDAFLGLEGRPWTDEAFGRRLRGRERPPAPARGPGPARPLADYAGTYEHPGYGTLEVRVDGGGLGVRLGELDLEVSHRHFETWDAAYPPLDASWPVTFVADARGVVAEAVVPLEPAVQPIRFRRREEDTCGS